MHTTNCDKTENIRLTIFKRSLSLALIALLVAILLLVAARYLFPVSPPVIADKHDRFTTIHNSKIRYNVIEGDEPTLILLHGFSGSLDNWKKIQRLLVKNKTVSLDLIGFGASDRPDIAYTLETQRKYLIAFMDKLKIKKAILIGTSMGGSVAAWTAAHSGERVEALIMLAPSGAPDSLKRPAPLQWFYRPGIPNHLAAFVVDNPIYRWIFPNSIASQAIYVTRSYNQSFTDALPKIKQPTLLGWSRGDTGVPYEYHAVYLQKIPNIKFVELSESAGHAVTNKNIALTAKAVNEFIMELHR